MANAYGQIHTTFPGKIQTFKAWDNISQADAENYATYINAIANKNTAKARDALSKIENADSKLITANDINIIADTVVALEKFYLEGIGGAGMREMLAQYAYKGDWNNSTTYNMFNLVRAKESTGRYYIYMCVEQGVTNKNPESNPMQWVKISVTGTSHYMSQFNGLYQDDVPVYEAEIVVYDNAWYLCKVEEVTGHIPPDYPDEFEKILDFNRANTFAISADEPVALVDGGLWFKVVG